MGHLYYGAQRLSIGMDDRLLLHLQVVATSKLRRGEGFLLTWPGESDSNASPGAVWIHPGSELHYDFAKANIEALDRDLLDRLNIASVHARGVNIADLGPQPVSIEVGPAT